LASYIQEKNDEKKMRLVIFFCTSFLKANTGIKSLFNSAYDLYKRLDEDRKVEVRFGVKIAS
jgi:hypothetical protein